MLVSACLITYNHESYITQCIEGMLSQKINYDYEIVIGDDCSKDSTTKICKFYAQKFPDLIKYKKRDSNLGMIGNWINTLNECKGKYIALCEGDDYWTDPLKLQKQVDFLEGNKDYSICWTNYEIEENGSLKKPNWFEGFFRGLYKDINFNNFGSPYCTYTLTCMFKSSCLENVNFNSFKFFKDNTLYSLCLQKGKGAILNFFGGVYRINNASIYSSASRYSQAISNYTNFAEILLKIPESRVDNIKNKKRIWEKEFFKELTKQPFSKLKKLLIRFNYYRQFKNA